MADCFRFWIVINRSMAMIEAVFFGLMCVAVLMVLAAFMWRGR